MTPRQITAAYKAVQELSAIVFPYRVSRRVTALKKRLEDELDAIRTTENALIGKHGGETAGGRCKFPSTEAAQAFAKEYEEAMEQNDETVKLPAVDLSKYTDMLRLSPGAVEALEGIVIFEEGAEDG